MREEQKQISNDFRIVYLATPKVVEVLKQDFTRAGAQVLSTSQNHQVVISDRLARKIARHSPLPEFQGDTATVYFYSDSILAARDLHNLDADLVIVDERNVAHHKQKSERFHSSSSGSVLEAKPPKETVLPEDTVKDAPSANEIVNFENFAAALKNFTPKKFHYPTRRILVVIPEENRELNRAFKLGLANVRAVITDPSSSLELFLFGMRELAEYRHNRQKNALCLSGGGLEGYIYSLGVLSALDDCFVKAKCTDFDIFTGVSSGAILSTVLAANVSSDELIKQLYRREGRLEPLSLGVVFDFAASDALRRVLGFVRTFSSFDPAQIVTHLRALVPNGLFRGDKLRAFVEKQLRRIGVTDKISALPKPCFISATDLDTGEQIVFGEKPWQDVKVSQAVRASTALPPFYLPERINGHWFTDGQLKSSYNFDSAISRGAGLILLVDPMVAYSTNTPGVTLKHGGYFVAVQAVKSLVESRSVSMLTHAMDMNPDVDFVVFRPTDEVMEAMAGNPMHYRIRTELAELGYRGTLLQILADYESMARKLGKRGFVLKTPEEIKALLRV